MLPNVEENKSSNTRPDLIAHGYASVKEHNNIQLIGSICFGASKGVRGTNRETARKENKSLQTMHHLQFAFLLALCGNMEPKHLNNPSVSMRNNKAT